jgi:hypothetical protein
MGVYQKRGKSPNFGCPHDVGLQSCTDFRQKTWDRHWQVPESWGCSADDASTGELRQIHSQGNDTAVVIGEHDKATILIHV